MPDHGITAYDLPHSLYVKPWVPQDRATWAAWTLADCDCEPMSTHCVRCDSRRIMLAVHRRHIEGSGG